MKKIVLGLSCLVIAINGMNQNQEDKSVIPVSVTDIYLNSLFIPSINFHQKPPIHKQIISTSRITIISDCFKQKMEIRYNTSTFTLPATHPLVGEIRNVLSQLRGIKSGFFEKTQEGGIKSYYRISTPIFSQIYNGVERYLQNQNK